MARLKAPALSLREFESKVLQALGGDPVAPAPSCLRLTLSGQSVPTLLADATVRIADGAAGSSWCGAEPVLDLRLGRVGPLQRFRRVDRALDELRADLTELMLDGPDGELCRVDALPDRPLGFVGFAFDDGRRDGALWSEWPCTRLIVPGLLLTTSRFGAGATGDTETSLTLTILGEGRTAAEVARELALARARVGVTESDTATGTPIGASARRTLGPNSPGEDPSEPAESFEARVAAAREAVRLGYLDKVVLARSAALSGVEPEALLQALKRQEPDSLGFLFHEESSGEAFVGATPERLLRQRGGRLETHALAGTAPRGDSRDEDERLGEALLASAKDRLEQAVVDDTLRRELSAFNLDPVDVGAPRLRRLARLQHLETPLILRFRDRPASILEVAARLHPTPALGGLPRGRARTWLRDREPLDRGWYGGLVGWVGARPHEGLLAVAIRSALLVPGRTHAFAGVGIVAGSDPASEWRETELKLSTIRDALRLASGAGGALDARDDAPKRAREAAEQS